MIPGIFTEFHADQLVKETVQRIIDHSDIPVTSINSIDIQHDMVMTNRHKVGKGPEENWRAVDYGQRIAGNIPLPGHEASLEWVVN